jgi:hypothetical protein
MILEFLIAEFGEAQNTKLLIVASCCRSDSCCRKSLEFYSELHRFESRSSTICPQICPSSGSLNIRKRRFGIWNCFHPQIRGGDTYSVWSLRKSCRSKARTVFPAPTLESWVRIPLRHGCLCVCANFELNLLVKLNEK